MNLTSRNKQERIQSILSISNIKTTQLNTYSCNAINRAGNSNKIGDIYVKGKV